MKKVGVYKIVNTRNNNLYIGLSRDILKRFKQHKWKLNHNKHVNEHLQNAWNKYGEDAFCFEIIEECSEEKLNEREIYWINFYGGYNNKNLYNMKDGGDSMKLSSETIEKIRKANLGENNHMFGKHLSEKTKRKLSESLKGKKHNVKYFVPWNKGGTSWSKGKHLSEEHKRKIGLANKGRKFSREAIEKGRLKRIGIKPWNTGMKMSDEYRNKLSEAHKGQKPWIAGKHHSLETKIKSSRPVLQFDLEGNLVAEYYGTVEAEKHTGIDNSNIVRCCRGKRRKAGGFIWKYK